MTLKDISNLKKLIYFGDLPFSFDLKAGQFIRRSASPCGLIHGLDNSNPVLKLSMNVNWDLLVPFQYFYRLNNPRIKYWKNINLKSRFLYTYLFKKSLNINYLFNDFLSNDKNLYLKNSLYKTQQLSDVALSSLSPRNKSYRIISSDVTKELDFSISSYHYQFDIFNPKGQLNLFWIVNNGIFKDNSFFIKSFDRPFAVSSQKFFMLKNFWKFITYFKSSMLKFLDSKFYPNVNTKYLYNLNYLFVDSLVSLFKSKLNTYINYDLNIYSFLKLLILKYSKNIFYEFRKLRCYIQQDNLDYLLKVKEDFSIFKKLENKGWFNLFFSRFNHIFLELHGKNEYISSKFMFLSSWILNIKKEVFLNKFSTSFFIFLIRINFNSIFSLFIINKFYNKATLTNNELYTQFNDWAYKPNSDYDFVLEFTIDKILSFSKRERFMIKLKPSKKFHIRKIGKKNRFIDYTIYKKKNFLYSPSTNLNMKKKLCFNDLWRLKIERLRRKKHKIIFYSSIGSSVSTRRVSFGSAAIRKHSRKLAIPKYRFSILLSTQFLGFFRTLTPILLWNINRNVNIHLNFYLTKSFKRFYLNFYFIFYKIMNFNKNYMSFKNSFLVRNTNLLDKYVSKYFYKFLKIDKITHKEYLKRPSSLKKVRFKKINPLLKKNRALKKK